MAPLVALAVLGTVGKFWAEGVRMVALEEGDIILGDGVEHAWKEV